MNCLEKGYNEAKREVLDLLCNEGLSACYNDVEKYRKTLIKDVKKMKVGV